jgi:misacylated tRNA(Ala) deacylase
LIERAVDTETAWITDAQLDAQPELVRTMSVKPPRGTGRVRLLRIRSEGRRNRRVEIGFA